MLNINNPMRMQSAKSILHEALNNPDSSTKNVQRKKMEVVYRIKEI